MTSESHESACASHNPGGMPRRQAVTGLPFPRNPAELSKGHALRSWIRRSISYPLLHLLGRRLLICGFLGLILFADLISAWPVVQPSTAFALAFKNPNPTLSAPSWLTQSATGKKPNLNQSAAVTAAAPSQSTPHQWAVTMQPARLTLTATAQQFVGSDGQLEVDIPANSLDATQLAQASGGIMLYITQVKGGSGSTDGGLIAFGTYEFQFFDGSGQPLTTVRLLQPLTLHFHLRKDQQQLVWSGQKVYTISNTVNGSATPPVIASSNTKQPANTQAVQTGIVPQAAANTHPTLAYAQGSKQGMDWAVQSRFAAPSSTGNTTANTQAVSTQGVLIAQASTVAYNTQAPQATWGTPTVPQVGLNAGGLNYSYPLNIPAGPGGFQPSLALNYSSGSVNENHGWQSASPWVGQGWSLDMGSISWAQENVTPNGTATMENVWHISDPSGLGGQLIPPDRTDSTIAPYNPSSPTSSQVWHTAPESHAKVIELMVNSAPCWRVYLPSGVMEEFGCTDDARESYVAASGNGVAYAWKLDLMIDRSGNQVHVNYQRLHPSNNYVIDAVLNSIEYDDPTCHNTTTSCTTWNPQVKVVFDANQSVAHLLNGGCGSGSSSARCDDPVDLSGSGGLPAPKVMSAYVLNDVKVEVQNNVLHEYVFSYNQSGPGTLADPNTGHNESVAGYLTLGKIQEEGTNGSSLNAPVVTASYTEKAEHYSDLISYSDNGVGDICNNSYTAAPRDGSSTGPCYLWGQTHNQYYISNLDNGRGWNESISWQEAHGNTWGTDNGTNYNNAFQCSSSQTSTNVCGTADDKSWSRIAVASRTTHANGVDSTWSYGYYLTNVTASIPGKEDNRSCHGGCESYDWGNQNDDDSADYYNGDFQSFSQVQVTQPDGSSQTDTYGATNGWGLFSSSIQCAVSPCTSAPYNGSGGPVLAGKQLSEQDYDGSSHLLKQINTTWATNCKPQGVPGTQNAQGGSSDPGSSQLFSELDRNNPLLVCDPRASQTDTYLTDGVTNTITDSRVVHTTTIPTYDGNTCGSQNYDYGNVTKQDQTANDVGGAHIVNTTLFCPNDNVSSGVYLTNLPAQMQTQDGSGTQYGCTQNYYGSNTSVTAAPTLPEVTRTDQYTPYTGGCTGIALTTLHSYDSSGNSITGTDPDGHLGCTSGASQYTACAVYDSSSFNTHLLTATNAKNQVITYEYDPDAAEAGYGQWLMSTTDANGQTTTYQYDALGRLTAISNPGDSASNPTITYAYINTCSAGQTTPCLEITTAARFTASGPLSTEKQWYDGWGNLVETQVPGPNLFSKVPAIPSTIVTYTIYDKLGHATTKSLPYAVAATAGLGYVAPDLNQARTVTSYDSLGRSLGTVTYSNATTIVQKATISYTVALGVPTFSSENNNAYEQSITLDAYNHQSIGYTDGFGRLRYGQVFSGTASPYTIVRTTGTTYDTVGNQTAVQTYDSTGTFKAGHYAAYDGVKRLFGFNDSDQGSCSNIPMPADCSSSADAAWKYTYDANGNPLSQTDARNQSTYTTYDALDRPLCRALTSANASSCSGSTYAVFFYDSYTNAGTPGASFPSACTAPTGSYASNPIGHETAELFVGASGAGNGWRCYGYDGRGRTDQSTLSVTTPDAHTVTQTVNMTYDDQNDVTSLVYPDSEVLTSNYDSNGRFQSAYFGTASTPDPVQFLVGKTTYTNNGQLAGLALGGSGAKTSTPMAVFNLTQGYDSIQRAVSTGAVEGSTTLFNQTRTYDNNGNVLGLATSTVSQTGSAVSENESFCYDALNRLTWAGNSSTPTGGDHCMGLPSTTGVNAYSQANSYDSLDRLTSSSVGTYTYGNANQVHGVTGVSTAPNQYATYDAMGNMLCRNIDTTTAHTCAGSSSTGATMSYDNEGRLVSWTAPSGTSASETYLYDNEGNQVLDTTSQSGSPTDTVYFDAFTKTVIASGTTTTTKYYSINGQRLAMRVGGSTITYLVSDLLSNVVLAVNNIGTVNAVQLYEPYGKMNYTWGTMPTDQNYTGQRLDSLSGLLYYNFRWYDSLTGQFVRTDTKQNNATGQNPYAYVNDNPETRNDPTGHWDWGTVLTFTAIAVVVAVVVIFAAPVVLAAAAAVAVTDIAVTAAIAIATVATAVTLAAPEILAGADEPMNLIGMPSSAGCGLSFRADTNVATPKGEQAIGTLKVGQEVLAYNSQTRKMEPKPIEKIWLNHDTDLVDLTLVTTVKDVHGKTTHQKEVLHTNEKHPFLTKEKGFIPVSQLKSGMHVLASNGNYGVVARLVIVPGAMWMYNLTVAQDHTYAVGVDQWIVHNCTPPIGGQSRSDLGNVKGFGVSIHSHFDQHGKGVGATTEEGYDQKAMDFMSGAPTDEEYQIWNPATKQFYRWNTITGEFGIYNPSQGRMISYYNLGTGWDADHYFSKQAWATGKRNPDGSAQYADGMPKNPEIEDDVPDWIDPKPLPGME